MLKTGRILFIVLLAATSLTSAYGNRSSGDSLQYEVLLTPSMADEINPVNRFINSIDITANRLILLSNREQFFLLGWGGIVPFAKKVTGNIGSFAYTSDSLLMTIRNDELCIFDRNGNLSRLYTLPSQEMGISRGKHLMYIFDRTGSKPEKGIYALSHGGMYSRLFSVPDPVYSLVELDDRILFTNRNIIFEYVPAKKEMKAVASLPEDKTIRSLTADPATGRIYFSTDNMIFSFKGREQTVITDQIGGKLMYYNGLIVFNPEKKLLVRITGLDRKIASVNQAPSAGVEKAAPAEVLTNESVIGFVRDKLPDGIIISIINRSKVSFDLGVDSMIELSNRNVSSNVIMAMKEAMKKQTEKKQ